MVPVARSSLPATTLAWPVALVMRTRRSWAAVLSEARWTAGNSERRETSMLVPFGTRVVDVSGKGVGTVSRLILHPDSREVSGLVVHQGVVNRREVVVPLSQVAGFSHEVRLRLRAPELEGFDLFHAPSFREMPDHW